MDLASFVRVCVDFRLPFLAPERGPAAFLFSGEYRDSGEAISCVFLLRGNAVEILSAPLSRG